jgi:60 kDa SS-A/Ro ribonucleoprotein
MSLFNTTEKRTKMRAMNKEGAPAFKPSEKTELVLRAATTMGQSDKFYETGASSDERFVELIHKVSSYDPEFVLKLAYYTRKNFYLRTPATILLAEYARSPLRGLNREAENPSDYVAATISRVDDMTELVSYCMKANERDRIKKSKIPMMIKRGVAKAFNKFDSYQYAKYTKPDMFVTPKDIMFLTHPKPREFSGQMELFDRIVNGTLEIPETWETYISINGSTKENWSYILDKMGYFAIVRNLRNLIKHGVDADDIVNILIDENRVRKSKMLPFQFYSAYRAIEQMPDAGKIMGGLSVAMDISAENFPVINGKTAVFCDNSGSMRGSIHPRSSITHADVGNVFGAMIAARSDARVCAFGSEVVPSGINPRDSILTNAQKIKNAGARAGGATYTGKCIEYINDINVDRIVFFTDQQGYGIPDCYSALKDYRKNHENDPYVYTFDLAHYGTTQFPENEPRHATVGGWSDTILKFIHLYESDRMTLVHDVENVKIV